MEYKIAVSPGELLDRWTILLVKEERLKDTGQIAMVRDELGRLGEAAESLARSPELSNIAKELHEANLRMWDKMQSIYDWQGPRDSSEYAEIVISIIDLNKDRAIAKRKIDQALDAGIMEAKSFFTGTKADDAST